MVFVPGMEDGIFPGVQAIYNEEDMQEERRLAYVAITRAKEELYLIKSKSRMLFGSTKYNRPSVFISEIPEEYIEQTQAVVVVRNPEIVENAKPKAKLMTSAKAISSTPSKPAASTGSISFAVGDTVIHSKFGQGKVVSAQSLGNDMLVEIAFDNAAFGSKKLMAKFAGLEKV